MQKVYHIENVETITGYDEYIKDFEEQAKEYCFTSCISLLQTVFSEFTTDMNCGIYLDGEQTNCGYSISFSFIIDTQEGEPKVSYAGFY